VDADDIVDIVDTEDAAEAVDAMKEMDVDMMEEPPPSTPLRFAKEHTQRWTCPYLELLETTLGPLDGHDDGYSS